ncbi:MAG: hypothetical protein A2Z21_10405 [Candidatus Fraserbacteria bacterium RBG_16_55_9]|uniref:Peptidase S8/S53 domain-containing protein n=1 Tax=Fraserbacteria sp. (strain RBG_16_55_9) TaxID=1817864 RepID=A0A1F5URW7_FRAXR|nr:MAG: hypothetical protein A2Z21_10405 [Candidatus Fraserbacteria bacterium RBG_16_55_9]
MRLKYLVFAVIWIAVALWMGQELFAEETAVIIGLKNPEGLSAQSIAQALGTKIQEQDGQIMRTYHLIDALAAHLSEEALRELSKDPSVRYIVPDGIVFTPERLESSPELSTSELELTAIPVELYSWGVKRVKAPVVHRSAPPIDTSASIHPGTWGMILALGLVGTLSVLRKNSQKFSLFLLLLVSTIGALGGCTMVVVLPHPGILGEGIEVALLDTGVDLRHPDLRTNVLGGIDLVNDDDDPQDDNGHGTGVAGILAAAENGQGLVGVAPKTGIWVVKMLGENEQGSISDLIQGIEWAAERGVKIISMSLGTTEDNAALHEAIRAAERAGILLVAAAGNKGSQVLFPAAYPEVIAVAASDKNDQHAWFSNMGPEVELTAPGTDLLSTGLKGQYQSVNGTSFSVPHVTGVAALLFSSGVSDSQEVRRRLDQTAEDLGLAMTAQGYGLVDAERAVLGRQ